MIEGVNDRIIKYQVFYYSYIPLLLIYPFQLVIHLNGFTFI